jgi:hypothetical protein
LPESPRTAFRVPRARIVKGDAANLTARGRRTSGEHRYTPDGPPGSCSCGWRGPAGKWKATYVEWSEHAKQAKSGRRRKPTPAAGPVEIVKPGKGRSGRMGRRSLTASRTPRRSATSSAPRPGKAVPRPGKAERMAGHVWRPAKPGQTFGPGRCSCGWPGSGRKRSTLDRWRDHCREAMRAPRTRRPRLTAAARHDG